jgi:hypothetical protein
MLSEERRAINKGGDSLGLRFTFQVYSPFAWRWFGFRFTSAEYHELRTALWTASPC